MIDPIEGHSRIHAQARRPGHRGHGRGGNPWARRVRRRHLLQEVPLAVSLPAARRWWGMPQVLAAASRPILPCWQRTRVASAKGPRRPCWAGALPPRRLRSRWIQPGTRRRPPPRQPGVEVRRVRRSPRRDPRRAARPTPHLRPTPPAAGAPLLPRPPAEGAPPPAATVPRTSAGAAVCMGPDGRAGRTDPPDSRAGPPGTDHDVRPALDMRATYLSAPGCPSPCVRTPFR